MCLLSILGISQIYPDSTGNKVVIIDEKCDAFLYNPISDYLLQLPDVSPSVTSIVWDSYPDDRVILTDTKLFISILFCSIFCFVVIKRKS